MSAGDWVRRGRGQGMIEVAAESTWGMNVQN